MAAAITPISATSPSAIAQIWSSISVADPDNAWVAARQSRISSDRLSSQTAERVGFSRAYRDWDVEGDNAEDRRFQTRRAVGRNIDADGQLPEPKLSGESERIGTAYFDDDTPFGERFAIV